MKYLMLYKEFGVTNGPSIVDGFSDSRYPEQDKVISYLNSGKVILAASGHYRDVVTGEKTWITKSIQTDGEYSWPGIMSYYVEKYNLRLPDEFVKKCSGQEKDQVSKGCHQNS